MREAHVNLGMFQAHSKITSITLCKGAAKKSKTQSKQGFHSGFTHKQPGVHLPCVTLRKRKSWRTQTVPQHPFRILFTTLSLIAMGLLLPAVSQARAGALPPTDWHYTVKIDDRIIGDHHFELTPSPSGVTVLSNANFNVKLLFVTVFDYQHSNTESWNGNCLEQISSATKVNRRRYAVEGERTEGGFDITGSEGSRTLPDCVQTFAYWNPHFLTADNLLNAQTGLFDPVTVAQPVRETGEIAGRSTDLLRYDLTVNSAEGPNAISVWYQENTGLWVGLESVTKDGQRVKYELQAWPKAPGTQPPHNQVAYTGEGT